MRTIAAKFPKYSFEDLLDKTPAWINWAALQAVNLESDMMKKVDIFLCSLMGTGTKEPAPQIAPQGRLEEIQALKRMGIKVKRV